MKIYEICDKKVLDYVSEHSKNLLLFGSTICSGYKVNMKYSAKERSIFLIWESIFSKSVMRAKIIKYESSEWIDILSILPFEKPLILSKIGYDLLERKENENFCN